MRTRRCRITISGGAGQTSREASGDLMIEPDGTGTVLTGVLDQAGLHGVLTRI